MHVPGVKYLAGQTFQSEYGVHEAGSEVPEATKFGNLDVLVSSHFLYPYAPDLGYEWLPPHLYSAVQTRKETQDMLDGDPSGTRAVPQYQDNEKPDSVVEAERDADNQNVIREQIMATDQPGNPGPADNPTPEQVAQEATTKRSYTKRSPSTNRSKNHG